MSEAAHLPARLEEVGEAYVLVCSCGWRSHARARAAEAGAEWDRHAETAGLA